MKLRDAGALLVSAGKDWVDDKAPRLAAALSYYTAFALPPLLILLVGIAGLVYGADVVRERMIDQIAGLIGEDSAQLLGDAISESEETTGSGMAVVLGLGALLFGATGVFGQLKDALNTIWEAKPPPSGSIWGFFRARLFSFAALLGAAFLLVVSLAVSALIGGIVDMAGQIGVLEPILVGLDLLTSTLVITVLFALMFKYLPDVEIRWADVWFGAAVTAALFVAGKFAIGLYIGTSEVGSVYGAAGSLVIILVWIYYSALILFYGAELTQAWSKRRREAHPGPRSRSTPEVAPRKSAT
jgi:membrane protein